MPELGFLAGVSGVGVGWEQDKPDKGKFSVVVIDSICGNSYVKIHLGPGIFLL